MYCTFAGKFYASSGHGKKLNKQIQRLGKHGLAREKFEEFASENEELLMVPNKYLGQICARTLGKERWLQITEVRQAMNQNEFMDIYDFLTILNAKTGSNIEFVTLAEHTENVSYTYIYIYNMDVSFTMHLGDLHTDIPTQYSFIHMHTFIVPFIRLTLFTRCMCLISIKNRVTFNLTSSCFILTLLYLITDQEK